MIPISLLSLEPYIKQTQKEGMAGYSEKAAYFGAYVDNIMVGFTSIQPYATKTCKFNNHYIFPEFRGNGHFKAMLDWSIWKAKETGYDYAVAACTSMSIKQYLKRGAVVTKTFKICTNVKLPL